MPFAPLAVLVNGSDDPLGRRLRLSAERIARARELGLTVWTADRLAALAGFHPLEVWGFEWAWAIDREVAADVSVVAS